MTQKLRGCHENETAAMPAAAAVARSPVRRVLLVSPRQCNFLAIAFILSDRNGQALKLAGNNFLAAAAANSPQYQTNEK